MSSSTVLSCWCPQSAQTLAQISDLQSQLEEALKDKQDVQEKVSPDEPKDEGNTDSGWVFII